MKKVPTNQGVANIAIIVVGLILSAILIGFFAFKGGDKSSSPPPAPSGADIEAPIYPNLSTSTLPPGCTEISAYSVTTGESCNPASTGTSCGLTVSTPSPNQTVSNGSIIKGKVNGCGWIAFEAQTGTVQAFKADGVPASGIIILQAQGEWMQVSVNFKATLSLPQNPPSGSSGFLLFTNEDPSGSNPQVFKLPVKF